MATTIFGQKTKAKLFIPKGTATWDIKDVVKKGEFDNVLLMSFSISDQEIIDVKRCFEETTHIFAFGRNTTACILDVTLLFFLSDGCEKSKYKWMKVQDIRDKYEKARIYKKKSTVQVTIDDISINGYLIRLLVDNVDPSKKTCLVNLTFLMDQEV